MRREMAFVVGGTLLLGGALIWIAALAILAASPANFGGFLGGALTVGFGAFFIHVGRAEGRERREELAERERNLEEPRAQR
ncbi:MAG: hypothetical protein ACREBT_05590 [Thermoplasmata archaeon]